MPRDLVLGNGNLLVCLDHNLSIRDLYWPHVGMFNHVSGRAIRFGLWINHQFSWIDASWDRDLRYRPDSLVTRCRLRNSRLQVTLHIEDAVETTRDVFVRRVTIEDHSGKDREARLFLAADTVLNETDIGDSCYYDPYGDAVIHYKWKTYLLFGGHAGGKGITGYACGMKGVGGLQGTWKDCEDGELGGNPIAQGSVDSALRLTLPVPANALSEPADFWVIAGSDRDTILKMRREIQELGVETILSTTDRYWQAWAQRGVAPQQRLSRVDINDSVAELPLRVQSLFRQSLLIIRTQIDNGGAILAANDTDIMKENRAHYSYLWPRDGALVAHALDSVGFNSLSRQFFTFCERILPEERAAFFQKYSPDGSVGASWHAFLTPDGKPELPLQEDETALVVWAIWHHYLSHRDFEFAEEMYRNLVRPCADFILNFRDSGSGLPLPSWDLWEERRGVHTWTVCTVIAALRAATELSGLFGDAERAATYAEGAESVKQALLTHLWSEQDRRYARCAEVHADGAITLDRTQDSSLHALHLFDVLPPDDARLLSTMQQINERLWVKVGIGGMARYEADYYGRITQDFKNVPGNPWIICTLWRAQWEIAAAATVDDLQSPMELLEWATLTALPSGVLPEQIHPYNFTTMTVSPLTWSHSEFVETVVKWARKRALLLS